MTFMIVITILLIAYYYYITNIIIRNKKFYYFLLLFCNLLIHTINKLLMEWRTKHLCYVTPMCHAWGILIEVKYENLPFCAGYFSACKISHGLVRNLTTCSRVIFKVRTYLISIITDNRTAIKSRTSKWWMKIIKVLTDTINLDLFNLHKQAALW